MRFGEVASVIQRDKGSFSRHGTLDSEVGNLPQPKAGPPAATSIPQLGAVNGHVTILKTPWTIQEGKEILKVVPSFIEDVKLTLPPRIFSPNNFIE